MCEMHSDVYLALFGELAALQCSCKWPNFPLFPLPQSWRRWIWRNLTTCTWRWRSWSGTTRRPWSPNWRCATNSSTRRSWRTHSSRCCWLCRTAGGSTTSRKNATAATMRLPPPPRTTTVSSPRHVLKFIFKTKTIGQNLLVWLNW